MATRGAPARDAARVVADESDPKERLREFDSKRARNESAAAKPLALVLLLLLGGMAAVFLVLSSLPGLDRQQLYLPRNMEQLQDVSAFLRKYTDTHYVHLLFGFSCVYIFLQTFSIPGSIFLSFLAGSLFRWPVALLLVCSVSTIGASNSYVISRFVLGNLVRRFFPQKLEFLQLEVDQRRQHLLNYMLFLRITPLLPNWFINLASPLVGVPLSTFALATFFGVMLPSFFCVKAGETLQQLSSPGDAMNWSVFALLGVLGLLSILPTWGPAKRFLGSKLA